jgi:uncharacterized delta-60 repeat protein
MSFKFQIVFFQIDHHTNPVIMKSVLLLCFGVGLTASLAQAQNQNPYFLDPYFANNGVQVCNNPPWGPLQYRTYNVRNMTIAPDDKILVAGNQTPLFQPHGISGGHYAITRMKADGSLDSSFAGTGHKIFLSGSDGLPMLDMDQLIALPDNKIIYAGKSSTMYPSQMVVYKLNNDGSFDNTFGTNGKVLFNSGPLVWHSLGALGVQSTNKILLCGMNFDNIAPSVGSISRLNANGSVDNSFGSNGILVPNLGFINDYVSYSMIKVLSDNSFLVAGNHYNATTSERINFLAKFNENGVLQTNFGTNGKVIIPLFNTERLTFHNKDIEVDANGNIYINCATDGGSTGVKSVLVYKFNSNGVLNNSYGQNGRLAVSNIKYDSWYIYDAQLQNDKLLVGGMSDTGVNAPYMLQRFNADGTEDLTFANPLSYITDSRDAYDHFDHLGLQSNNRIMLAGHGKRDNKAADSIFPVVLRFLERGTEVPPPTDTGTSIVNIKDQNQIKVFPNPTRDLLYIQGTKGNAEVQCFDMSGRMMMKTSISEKSNQSIDCSQLPSGVYWLYIKVNKSQTVYIHKLVKP